MATCSKCGKKYKTYLVVISSKIECFAFEHHIIRDQFYDDDLNIGLCKKCRKRIYKNDLFVWNNLARVKINILCAGYSTDDKKSKKTYDDALKRTKDWIDRLEKTEAVQKYMRKRAVEEL